MQDPEPHSNPLPAWKLNEAYRVARFPILSLLGLLSGALCLAAAMLFAATAGDPASKHIGNVAGVPSPVVGILVVGFLIGTLMLAGPARKRGERGLFRGCGMLGCLLALGGGGVLSLVGFAADLICHHNQFCGR
jgi:hypothetical protein